MKMQQEVTPLDEYTRVSEVIQYFKPPIPDHLKTVFERKGRLGSALHEAIAAQANNEFFVVDEEWKEYWASWEMFQKEFPWQSEMHETRLYDHENLITGKIDCIMTHPELGRIIVDYKTSYEADYVYWPLQMAWYHILCKVNNLNISEYAMIIHLKKSKPPKKLLFAITPELVGVAISLYNAYRYFIDGKYQDTLR